MIPRNLKYLIPSFLLTAACSVNPATGERQLILVGEGSEIALGRDTDPQIVAQMGLYGGDEFQTYIQRIGGRMAALSERPDLPWTFRVVDDPIVNAFALPGGFIYITRGIMAHLNSEAQLAAVVGHEIGHVTGRHSVEQMSRQQLMSAGLVTGMILSDRIANLSPLLQSGLGMLSLKYGRDDETQADALGFRYVNRANYDPRPMADVYTMLDRVSQAHGGRSIPEWLSTHPNPVGRAEHIEEMLASANVNYRNVNLGRDSYLDLIDGMVYGDDPRNGYFSGDLFVHPAMEFQISFPAGWQRQNQATQVVAISPQQDAMMSLSIAQGSAQAAATDFAGTEGIVTSGPQTSSVASGTAYEVGFTASTSDGPVAGLGLFVEYGGSTFQILGYGTSAAWTGGQSSITSAMRSFGPVADRSLLAVQPQRIDVVTAPTSMTLATFVQRYPGVLDADGISLLNQFPANYTIGAGDRVKRVVQN